MALNTTRIFPRATARLASPELIEGACVTPEERAAAVEACGALTIRGIDGVRGLGQARLEEFRSSRFSGLDPCTVKNLPACPCVTEGDVIPVASCIAGLTPDGWSPAYHDQWCAQVGAGVMMNDWCPGTPLPPIPPCIEPTQAPNIQYCHEYGFGGPNSFLNGLCWAAIRAGVLPTLSGLPICQAPPGETAPPPPTTTRVPTTTAPPIEEEEPPPGAPRTERASMLLPGLLLLLIIGGGTAYYIAQRRR